MNNQDFNYAYQYSRWHSDDDVSLAKDKRFFDDFLTTHALFPENRDAAILEAGCGMGRCLLALRDRGYYNLTGFDVDRSQIEVARKAGLDVFLHNAETFFDVDERRFDVVYCFDVLEHLEKEKQLPFLRQIAERLTPNGTAVIKVPNALSPTFEYFRYDDFTHTVSYTESALRFLLANAGLTAVVVRPENVESLDVQRLKLPWAKLYRVEHGLKSIVLTPNIVAVAFKNDADLNKYLKNAPLIENKYSEGEIERYFSRWARAKRKFQKRLKKWGGGR